MDNGMFGGFGSFGRGFDFNHDGKLSRSERAAAFDYLSGSGNEYAGTGSSYRGSGYRRKYVGANRSYSGSVSIRPGTNRDKKEAGCNPGTLRIYGGYNLYRKSL